MAQSAKAKKPAHKETFWEWALRFSGISANPNTLKSAGDEPASGQIWLADVTSGTTRKITPDTGYRSPVFSPDGASILALKGEDVIRISIAAARTEKLYSISGISKLIGFSLDDTSEVLILKQTGKSTPVPAQLSITTGAITPLPYDPDSAEDRQMLEHLQGWQREYGTSILYVKRENFQALSGSIEIANVFLKIDDHDPQNISHCDTVNCGQPSLSPDKTQVVFIKASP
ncbi:MAG: hypothetical protein JO211_10655 [Acidobacteriaceae bacterium]|nr:hypothetical protein [Acidobacteriaceae bacterium]